MINYKTGDLIASVTEGVILHGCNALGVMGAGFALQLKTQYPTNFKDYQAFCKNYSDILGNYVCTVTNNYKLIIVNAITQQAVGGRRAVSYDAIDDIFHQIYLSYNNDWNKHIQMPKIGAGLGGGKWEIIEEIMLSHLPEDKDITVWVL